MKQQLKLRLLACLSNENSIQYKFKKYVFQILNPGIIIPGMHVYY
jgi:hypothetical protein